MTALLLSNQKMERLVVTLGTTLIHDVQMSQARPVPRR